MLPSKEELENAKTTIQDEIFEYDELISGITTDCDLLGLYKKARTGLQTAWDCLTALETASGVMPEKREVTKYKECSCCGDRYINEKDAGFNDGVDACTLALAVIEQKREERMNRLHIMLEGFKMVDEELDCKATFYLGNRIGSHIKELAQAIKDYIGGKG